MAAPDSIRRINRRRAFNALARLGQASRAELAKVIDVSAPTAGKVVDDLLAARLVEVVEPEAGIANDAERGDGEAMMGRPGQMLRLNRTQRCVVAVQLGVRHTRLAALPVAGPMGEDWPIQFRTPRNAEGWVKALRSYGRALAKQCGGEPAAVAVSVPGVVDEAAGSVMLSPNLHWTEQAELAALLKQIWQSPVCMVQEIRALVMGQLAERQDAVRVGIDGNDFLLVDFGEGVGGAAAIGGRLFRGATPLSGELGHTPVPGAKGICGCGGAGCLETLVSRRALLEAYVATGPKRGKGKRRRSWRELLGHIEAAGMEAWLAEPIDAAAVVIAGAMNVLGTPQVVVTGTLAELPPCAVNRLREGVARSAMWARFGEVQVAAAGRSYARGLVAAAVDRILLEAA